MQLPTWFRGGHTGRAWRLSAWCSCCRPVWPSRRSALPGARLSSTEPVQRLHTLQEAFAQLALKAELATTGFLEQIAALQARAEQQKAIIAELTSATATAERPLETQEQQLASITVQRDQARALVDDMQQAMAGVEDLLSMWRPSAPCSSTAAGGAGATAHGQRAARRAPSAGSEPALAARPSRGRDDAPAQVPRECPALARGLGARQRRALEELVVETGVDVEELIARAADEPAPGQGGPLQVAAPDEIGSGAAAADDTISGDIQRLELLQRIATTLPLASPLDQFHVTAHYGKRRDPFTRNSPTTAASISARRAMPRFWRPPPGR